MGASPHAQIAGFHYWGSALFITHSFLHLCAMIFTGWYRPPNHWRWFGALALFGCAMLFQITGNLLPFDLHGARTAAVEGGIAASMPLVGKQTASILLGGQPYASEATLSTWFFAHRLLIPSALFLGILGAVVQHVRRPESRTFWLPAAIISLIPLGLTIWLGRPLGSPASVVDLSRYDAFVSWYNWPLHGMLHASLKLGPSMGWLGSGLVPGIFVVFLISAPYLSKRIANSGIQFVFVAFVGAFLSAGALFGGSFAPLTGTRDPARAVSPGDSSRAIHPIDEAMADRGRIAFNSLPCTGCHGQDGLSPSGGPKLDKIYQEHGDPQWFQAFIRDPRSKKPGSTMPSFTDLPDAQVRDLAEFLRRPR